MQSLHPAAIAILIATALGAVSIIWSTLRIGISPMPSSLAACRAMVAASENSPPGPIVDLGSGWGTLAIAFARKYPQRSIVGYELSWLPWLFSCALKRLMKLDNLVFRRKDFRQAPWADPAVIVCYLYQQGMRDLERRLAEEGRPPALLLSNTFALPARRPDELIRLDDLYRTPIYVYRWR